MPGVVWKDPPQVMGDRTGSGQWAPLLTALQERPGKWALLRSYEKRTSASSAVYDLKRGRATKAFDPNEFEFTTRTNLEGGGDVYGRFRNGDRP